VELLLHPRQAVAAERLRIAVRLELELAELGRVVRILQLLEHRQHAARRGPAAIDEEQLLLGADPPHAGLEPALAQHPLERAQVREDRGHELAPLLGVGLRDVVLAGARHPSPRGAVHSASTWGSILRQVGQSWCQLPPHESTRLGIPFLPSTFASRHDSPMSSARPSPEISRMKRVRSFSRWTPSSIARKCSGDDTQNSSVKSFAS